MLLDSEYKRFYPFIFIYLLQKIYTQMLWFLLKLFFGHVKT